MATDLTPLVVGLVGVAFGGVGSTAMTAVIERGKLKHERDIAEADRKRAFRIEALEQSQASLLALYAVAFKAGRLWEPGVPLPQEVADDLNERRTEAIRWSDRLHDEDLREQCARTIGACVAYVYVDREDIANASTANEMEARVVEGIMEAQRGISEALRDLYD